ncbi:MAG: hypothetical protein JXQ29_17920 [Planctomycetes bacterium]|nr:hypothetical protein [Planctomycetota bacterium]
MQRDAPGSGLLLGVVLLVGLAACRGEDEHGTTTHRNDTLEGKYWYLSFARAVSTTIQPDLWTRGGVLEADGEGTLTYLFNLGAPLASRTRSYGVNTVGQIDNNSDQPGATLPLGELFELGDLDRTSGRIGIELAGKFGASLTVNDFVDAGGLSGYYHAVLLQFSRPGILTGTGNATLTKNDETTASWRIDTTLSTASTLVRMGALKLAPDGAVSAQDGTTSREYVGFGEPHGDWLVWAERDTSNPNQVYRMDILVRKGKGLDPSSLEGRMNLVGFYQEAAGSAVDTLFGRIVFDGQGSYSDFTRRNSFGNAFTTGSYVYPYDVAPDGRVTFVGGSNPIGFVSRSSARRLLVFPDVDPSGSPGSLGLFIALHR